MKTHQSKKLFLRAQKFLPGGINSPLRSFRSVGGIPRFISLSHGSKIRDVDRNEYIDYCLSWGAAILGHNHPNIVQIIKKMTLKGFASGMPTELEVELSELVSKFCPSIEMMRITNSGTEAVMSAIRLARAYTKRDRVIKFEGCYHGNFDGLLVKPGSGVTYVTIPASSGIPVEYVRPTIVIPFNDTEIFRRIIRENYRNVAAVILEPIPTNMGIVLPDVEFLTEIRENTKKYGIILIFDEITTGFRVGLGGAQEYFNIIPDVTCIGKVIGGGFSIGIYGGKKELFEYISPLGSVYQASTLSGNPIAMACAIEILKILSSNNIYSKLEENTKLITNSILQQADELKIKVQVNQVHSMFTLFFAPEPVKDLSSAKITDTRKYAVLFHALLNQGIYFPPTQFGAAFLSSAHEKKEIKKTIDATYKALKEVTRKTS